MYIAGYLFHCLYKRQKQPMEVFCKISVFRNFTKFTGKHLGQNLFNNAACLITATIKKEILTQVFPVNFVKLIRTPFSQRNSG